MKKNTGAWLIILSFFISPFYAQNILTKLEEGWTNGTWDHTIGLFYTYNYDEDSNLSNIVGEVWDADMDAYINYDLDEYIYDDNGNVIQYNLSLWSNASQSWQDGHQYFYEYDDFDNLQTTIWQLYTNGSWHNYIRIQNSYDIDNYLTESLSEVWQGYWDNTQMNVYTNDANGLLQERLVLDWDLDLLDWVNFNRYTFIYNASNNIQFRSQESWWDSAWHNDVNSNFTYDANDYLTNEVRERWDQELNMWIHSYNRIYTNNPNGSVYQTYYQYWNTTSNSWLNQWRETFSYDVLGVDDPAFSNEVSVFPNPNKGIVHIDFGTASATNLKVTDAVGRTIFSEENLYEKKYQFDFNQPAGIYFVEISSERNKKVFKLIKE